MIPHSAIHASYDDTGDVLYLLIGHPQKTKNVEQNAGLVLRYDPVTRAPVGATILDFQEYWSPRESQLVNYLATFFNISVSETRNILEIASHGH